MGTKTQNYQLNQWEGSDNFLRTDFNEDNAKIDGALKELADAVGTKAEQAALNTLTSTVNTKAAQSALEALSDTVDTKANQSDLNSLSATVDTKASQTALNSLTTTVNAKASQSDLNTLKTTVNSKANQSALDSLTTTLNSKASQSALNTLNTTVSNLAATVAAKCEIVTGSYTGNNATTHAITLGFQPKAVILNNCNGTQNHMISGNPYGGIFFPNVPLGSYATITSTGFTVSGNCNNSNLTYHYIAIK